MKVLFSTLVFAPLLLFAEPIGLVLSGGGAKGAYEVGVWKAMVEAGWAEDVQVISGTSVGALNGALFAGVKDPYKIEKIWRESVLGLMSPVVSNMVDDVQRGLEHAVRAKQLKQEYVEEGKKKFAREHGILVDDLLPDEVKQVEDEALTRVTFEMTKLTTQWWRNYREQQLKVNMYTLTNMLEKTLPEHWPNGSPDVYVTIMSKRHSNPSFFLINNESSESKRSKIAASCALPWIFEAVNIDGVDYQDGSVGIKGDNTPIQPIITNYKELRTIVVVYLNENDKKMSSKHKINYPGYRFIEIIPSKSTGGIIGCADMKAAEGLFQLGYSDAKCKLRVRP